MRSRSREHARNARPLAGQRRLLLDDRRQDQRLVRASSIGRSVGARAPRRVELASHALAGLPQDLEVGRALAEQVRVREEQRPRGACPARRAPPSPPRRPGPASVLSRCGSCLERAAQVAEGPALDDGHRVLHDRARLEQRQQAARRRAGRDRVLAGLDARVGAASRAHRPAATADGRARRVPASSRAVAASGCPRGISISSGGLADRERGVEPALERAVTPHATEQRQRGERRAARAGTYAASLAGSRLVRSSSARVTSPGAA